MRKVPSLVLLMGKQHKARQSAKAQMDEKDINLHPPKSKKKLEY